VNSIPVASNAVVLMTPRFKETAVVCGGERGEGRGEKGEEISYYSMRRKK